MSWNWALSGVGGRGVSAHMVGVLESHAYPLLSINLIGLSLDKAGNLKSWEARENVT